MSKTKQIVINVPDFINYEELEKEIKSGVTYELNQILKNEFIKTKEFKDTVYTVISEELKRLIPSTNLIDLLRENLIKNISEINDYTYEYKLEKILEEEIEENKEKIKNDMKPKLIESIEKGLDNYHIQSILSDIVIDELKHNGDYEQLIKDMLQDNFDAYFPKYTEDNNEN